MNHTITTKEIIIIGFMLFAIFFGAGNMIFPPLLGQLAGTNVWIAIIGFLLTGVGLPLLGIIAIARSGGDIQDLASRVHPTFGIIFSVIMYLTIGPLFGIPRTGTVSFEIGIKPFLGEELRSPWPLFIFSIIYFSLTAWLSLNPSKIVDRIGKILTPFLFAVISLLVIKGLMTPMGSLPAPNREYIAGSFFKGFLEGYFTMDTIASLVFGIVIISAIKDKYTLSKAKVTRICIQAGVIAALGLSFVYVSLGYMGASSVEAIGYFDNGGLILSGISKTLYGPLGMIILGTAITCACLTTSVGLVTACSQYFSKLFTISYSKLVLVLSLFSLIISNVGLTQLISFSIPVLLMIYPPAIVLIVLSFFHSMFKGQTYVYRFALLLTSCVSILDGLAQSKVPFAGSIQDLLLYFPLQSIGIGWLIPAVLGTLIGIALQISNNKSSEKHLVEN